MICFNSDYMEGAHPRVLQALVESNAEQSVGYGEDDYCRAAAELIRGLCAAPQAAVHFLTGGTQVNRTLIASVLRPHQGVIAADTGHIAIHESGAIENSGHKVLPLPQREGKVTAAQVEALVAAHYGDATAEHMVQPGMVYISNPTELGTVYTRQELETLHAVCRERGLPLYLDGARLGCALVNEDYAFPELAAWCDAFTIGGTKLGALFGEALIISNPALQKDFRYLMKQNGGLLAKGRLLGVQFLELLKDGLYLEIARQEVTLAKRLRDGLAKKGYAFLAESPTNQQFPILPEDVLCKLREKYSWELWQDMGEEKCVRFCLGWGITQEDVDALLSDIPARS